MEITVSWLVILLLEGLYSYNAVKIVSMKSSKEKVGEKMFTLVLIKLTFEVVFKIIIGVELFINANTGWPI